MTLFYEMVRFVLRESLRPRSTVVAGTFFAVAVLETLVVLQSDGGVAITGTFMLVGLLVISSPLCRSWVDEDVRLGYGAFWLQKRVSVIRFYLVRLLAAAVLALGLGVMIVFSTAPALILGSSLGEKLGELLIIGSAVPVLLVFLSFLGSSGGVRNSGLFAYVLLFAGLWIGVSLTGDPPGGARLVQRLEPFLPPVRSLLEAGERLRRDGPIAALASLGPVAVYLLATGGLGLLFALRTPARLSRTT